MYDIFVILFCLALLIALAYRGGSLVLLAPATAVLAVTLGGQGDRVLAAYSQIFMGATGGFIVSYFPLFLLGAVFGKLMDVTGSARVLSAGIVRRLGAGRAILAVILSCAAMTYGGVSLFVVAFAIYPVALRLFRRADLPERLMPATIALGAFTFTMSALPGAPSIQNAIPMPFFGTTPFAAPGLGVIASIVMFVAGWRWLEWRAVRLGPGSARGEGASGAQDEADDGEEPSMAVAVLPLVLVLAANLFFTAVVIPGLDTSYLALPLYGQTSIDEVRGVWSVTAALALSILALIVLNLRRLRKVAGALDEGAADALLPIFNTASLVGFGAVVASLSGFALINEWLVALGADNPLVSLAVASSLLAGLTGSASGGMSIALTSLGETYLGLAQAAGISPELLHRVTTLATGGLDTLPHNGAVITLLSICGLSHRQAYADIAVVGVLFPVLALILVIALGSLFGSF
ncbi:transporter [Aureimonas altamirensis]|uniref:Transporter n=1 Tax=Aureimonas altamirensis TaxID=370622 RepID=A0A0B1Q3F6_9HYPH|nr:GntP family permease [Aureimonas altamirensis]KHJ53901.1 transporter [Aureimonas altamirensis]